MDDPAARLVGFDTETYNGRAVLLGTPRRWLEPHGFSECAEFLSKPKGSIYVCWNLDYDVQAILKWLPPDVLRPLHLNGRVTWRGWKIQWMPRKRFRLRRRTKSCLLLDAATWYGTSLERASRQHLGKGKLPHPAWWFEDFRAALGSPRHRRKAILYCRRDALLAQHLARRTVRVFEGAGLNSFRAPSPASVASRHWRRQLRRPPMPPYILEAFARTYRGGRVEVRSVGRHRDCSYWDLNSAYPWASAKLVSMEGSWHERLRKGEVPSRYADYAALHLRAYIPLDWDSGPLPVQSVDGLLYPVGIIEGWYTLVEYRLLRRLGVRVNILRGWEIHCPEREPAFPDIPDLYATRKRLEGEGDKDAAWAIKIMLNGLYGKLAETRYRYYKAWSIRPGDTIWWDGDIPYGRRPFPARTANPVYAAAVTAAVRCRVFEETLNRRVIFAATDGVLLQGPEPPAGRCHESEFGAWKREGVGFDALIVSSGVYALKTPKGKWKTKWRGGDPRTNLAATLRALPAKARHFRAPVLRAPSIAEVSRGSVDEWRTMNNLRHEDLVCSLGADLKRVWPQGERRAGVLRRRAIFSVPYVWVDHTIVTPREWAGLVEAKE